MKATTGHRCKFYVTTEVENVEAATVYIVQTCECGESIAMTNPLTREVAVADVLVGDRVSVGPYIDTVVAMHVGDDMVRFEFVGFGGKPRYSRPQRLTDIVTVWAVAQAA